MVSDCLVLEEELKPQNSEHFNLRREVETDLLGLSIEAKEKLASCTVSTARSALNDDPLIFQKLLEFDAEIIVFYGCSIIKQKILEKFNVPLINVHLGLSPYYRGAGTNFWPFFNKEPEFCGVTYHQLIEKVDAGRIYLQRRSSIENSKNIHEHGFNLIAGVPTDLDFLLRQNLIEKKPIGFGGFRGSPRRLYKKSDFTEKNANFVNHNFEEIVLKYQAEFRDRNKMAPIIDRSYYP